MKWTKYNPSSRSSQKKLLEFQPWTSYVDKRSAHNLPFFQFKIKENFKAHLSLCALIDMCSVMLYFLGVGMKLVSRC